MARHDEKYYPPGGDAHTVRHQDTGMPSQTIYIFAILCVIASALMISGCSDISKPHSLEPVIEILEISEISRTEATVKATIDRHGSTRLSYVSLLYGETENTSDMKINGDTKSDTLLFHLSDLKPGASYACHIEAGTETAALKSNTISFTTIPNNPPIVSAITPLSTGPLGIIVSFVIIDHGGEEITEAGCEIKEAGSIQSRRIYAPIIDSQQSEVRITINGLTPAMTYSITPFASNSLGESHGETLEYTTKESILLTEPGVLAELFKSTDSIEMEILTISGPMNGDDFRTLRAMLGAPIESEFRLGATSIDLSDTQIVEGGASYDGQRFTATDRLSTGLLADCLLLRSVILPGSATVMEYDALARCPLLEVITIPACVETLLPSTGCQELTAIEVSKANNHFSSINGVLFNQDASEILWFPCGKTGEYTLPPSVTTIKENAFAGTSITSLIIPSSVRSISRGAFAGSAITEIRLPDSMTNISEGTFQNCSNLIDVYLGANTNYVGNFAFDGTAIHDLYIAAETPPFTMEDAFKDGDSTIFDKCTLHVPNGCIKVYTNHRQWGSFSKIEEFRP